MIRKIGMLFAGLLLGGAAAAENFQEGVHYQRIEPAQPTQDPSQVEVVEVFGYLCPHCANFQPHVDAWLEDKPEHADFRRLPVVFRPSWEPYARAYYTAQALGVLDQAHTRIFDALHKERRQLRTNEDLAEMFAEEFGVSREEYLKTAKSFAIETRLRRGMAQARRYGVDATPTVVVNGKYRVTGNMAGSIGRLIEVIDHLVAMEAEGLETAGGEATSEAEPESAEDAAEAESPGTSG